MKRRFATESESTRHFSIRTDNDLSDSPLMTIEGVPGPSLEKLMVDIRRDKDFDYLAGEESSRMLEKRLQIYPRNSRIFDNVNLIIYE